MISIAAQTPAQASRRLRLVETRITLELFTSTQETPSFTVFDPGVRWSFLFKEKRAPLLTIILIRQYLP